MYILLIILFVIGTVLVYRIIAVKRQTKASNRLRFERVKSLYEKLAKGEVLVQQDVYEYAGNRLTRETTYRLLHEYNCTHVFPQEFISIVKAAESNLAGWLEFPTELEASPDEMAYLKRVSIDFESSGNFVHYEVFRFKVNEPHWAAEYGWMLGVVGPYFDDSRPYDHPGATFSRLKKEEEISPEEEVRWVHENISMKR